MLRKTAGVGGVLALVALGFACAGGAATASPWATDAGTTVADAAPLSTADGSSSAVAAPIYVATTGSDTAAGTSPTTPVQSIQTGLDLAAACPGAPCVVLVAGGKYQKSIQLRDGVSLYGQYSADFTSRAATNPVVITSNDVETVVASGLTKPTTVDGVEIVGATLPTIDGRSTYAVWVHASKNALTISNSEIHGGTAAAGAPGLSGGSLTCASTGGAGGVADDCDSNSGGAGTASGDPTSSGGGGGGGSSNCPSACPLINSDGISDGTAGSAGGAGAMGTGGAAAADPFGAFTAGLWTGAAAAAGTRGMHGTGGGGGGSGGTKRFVACFGCGTLLGGNGSPGGAGGCAGDGGGPGAPGGGSFGLVTDSAVTLSSVSVVAGVGGAGGAGGAGAAGQAGIATPDGGTPGAAGGRPLDRGDHDRWRRAQSIRRDVHGRHSGRRGRGRSRGRRRTGRRGGAHGGRGGAARLLMTRYRTCSNPLRQGGPATGRP
jgi:hypothetical protein